MKRCLFLMLSLAASALYSCNLQDAAPVPPSNPPAQKVDPYRGDYAHSRVNLNFDSGIMNVAASTILSVNLSDSTNSIKFNLGINGSANTITIVSLVHAENAIIQQNAGGASNWRLTFPQYSATDTLNQPYVRAVVTDDNNQTVTDYRGYLVGPKAKLDYLSPELPVSLTVDQVINLFRTTSGLKVAISQ